MEAGYLLHAPAVLPPERSPMNRRRIEPTNETRTFWKKTKILHLPTVEPRFLHNKAHRLVTVLTELYRLLSFEIPTNHLIFGTWQRVGWLEHRNFTLQAVSHWTYANINSAAMIGWKSNRSELLLYHLWEGGWGRVGAASGIQESSPMRAVAGVRCTGKECARVATEPLRPLLADFCGRVGVRCKWTSKQWINCERPG